MFRPMFPRVTRRALVATLCLALAFAVAACGDADDADDGGDGASTAKDEPGLVIYSGREEELVAPLYEQFEDETGIDVEVRYGDSAELAATLQEEGENVRADVFYSQDAGAIGSIDNLLAPLPETLTSKVDAAYRDPKGRWVGVTGRARVLAYNTERDNPSVSAVPAELPDSVFDLTDEQYKGRVGVAPTNASFEGFITAMRLSQGDARTLRWLRDMKANDAQIYEKNSQIVRAVADGEVDFGLVNHYYLYELKEEDPDAPVQNHFFAPGDPGTLVNVSAIGMLAGGEHPEQARRFVEFMLSDGQVYIANVAGEREYPLVSGIPGLERAEELPPLSEIKGPDVELNRFGAELEKTVEMIEESGLGA